MITLAFYSNKGGVGKTTAAVNIAYVASQTGLKTLICDFDPQGSCSFYFRVKPKLKSGSKSILSGKNIHNNVKGTDYDNLYILPADISMRNINIAFNQFKKPTKRLKKILKTFKNEFQFIVIDCPASLDISAENIFNLSDHIMLPLIPSTLSENAYNQFRKFIKKHNYVQNNYWVFFSMVDARKKLHAETIEKIKENYNNTFNTTIPHSSVVEKMGIHREPVNAFAPGSNASKAYHKLWEEISNIDPRLRMNNKQDF